MTAFDMEKLIFVHAGKAAYPEVDAGIRHFSEVFETKQLGVEAVRHEPGLEAATCWHIMGLYRERLRARRIVHDYRSLSIGFGRTIKDRLKARFNHRPDLRVYQNQDIRSAMKFDDGVPELLIPMGVPDWIVQSRVDKLAPKPSDGSGYDFCYIGSMMPERRIDLMIDSFLRRFGTRYALHLYGQPNRQLLRKFESRSNIVFAGTRPQKTLFSELTRFSAAVCYFPNHFPHLLQTPTKMLEYAALGMRIIANEHPQSRLASAQYGIDCQWGPSADMFAGAPDDVAWPDNTTLDPSPMLWSSVFQQSGVDAKVMPGW